MTCHEGPESRPVASDVRRFRATAHQQRLGDGGVETSGARVVDRGVLPRHERADVDGLVVRADLHGRVHAARLLTRLHDEARANGCGAIHLDFGVQRHDAHALISDKARGSAAITSSARLRTL